MVEALMIDLKALLVEREDCDAGTVQKIREALAQGGNQYRSLREATDLLRKKVEAATGAVAKRWHLKLGIASFFLGHLRDAAEHLRQAEGALANFYLGRALATRGLRWSWTGATPATSSSSATPTTSPVTTRRRSPTTSAASPTRRSTRVPS